MPIYVAKFRPLILTTGGQNAIQQFKLPPYVDDSCRREPDLESRFPSISAICRGELFAPHLREGDEVIYITMKGNYGEKYRHWRVVARLKIIRRFDSHNAAATWYRRKCGKVRGNCMVAENPPLPLNHTARGGATCAPGCGGNATGLDAWDARYRRRAKENPVFLACNVIWKDLVSPLILTVQNGLNILGSPERLNARLPIQITAEELQKLWRLWEARKNIC